MTRKLKLKKDIKKREQKIQQAQTPQFEGTQASSFSNVENFEDVLDIVAREACVTFVPKGSFAAGDDEKMPYGIIEDNMTTLTASALALSMKTGPEYDYIMSKDSQVSKILKEEFINNRIDFAIKMLNSKIQHLYQTVYTQVLRKIADYGYLYVQSARLDDDAFDEVFAKAIGKCEMRSNGVYVMQCRSYGRNNTGNVTDARLLSAFKANTANVEVIYNDFLLNRIPCALTEMFDIIHNVFTGATAVWGTQFPINDFMAYVSNELLQAKEYMAMETWNIIMSTIVIQESTIDLPKTRDGRRRYDYDCYDDEPIEF